MNHTIVKMASSMLNGKVLPNYFWAKTINTTVYILNKSATKPVEGKTVQEAYNRKRPSVVHFKVFKNEYYMQIPNEEQTKLEPKSHKCIFFGYKMYSKGYRLYGPQARKVLLSRDVVFQEDPKWYTQLLDGVDIPSTSSNEVPPRGLRMLELQRKT